MRKSLTRTILGCTLLVFIFTMPFWVSALLGTTLIIFYKKYWEGVAIAFIFDLFYGASDSHVAHFGIVTISAMVLYMVAQFAREKLLRKYD